MQRSIAFYLSLLAFLLLITSPSKSFAWPAKVLLQEGTKRCFAIFFTDQRRLIRVRPN
ncbi:MAG: hypothetical protein PHD01_18000 [Geobacteraceae bacterium]|nr:hypothetical protein [Geobacteraceae bacterium]